MHKYVSITPPENAIKSSFSWTILSKSIHFKTQILIYMCLFANKCRSQNVLRCSGIKIYNYIRSNRWNRDVPISGIKASTNKFCIVFVGAPDCYQGVRLWFVFYVYIFFNFSLSNPIDIPFKKKKDCQLYFSWHLFQFSNEDHLCYPHSNFVLTIQGRLRFINLFIHSSIKPIKLL